MTVAAGTGPGTINVTGVNAYLYFDNTQTFDNATINLGNSSAYYDLSLRKRHHRRRQQVLTLGSGVTVNVAGYAEIIGSSYSGDGIVNQGAIDDTGAGGFCTIGGNSRSPIRERSTSPTARRSTSAARPSPTAERSPSTGPARSLFDDTLTTAQLGTVNAASGATLDFAGGLDNAGATFVPAPAS